MVLTQSAAMDSRVEEMVKSLNEIKRLVRKWLPKQRQLLVQEEDEAGWWRRRRSTTEELALELFALPLIKQDEEEEDEDNQEGEDLSKYGQDAYEFEESMGEEEMGEVTVGHHSITQIPLR